MASPKTKFRVYRLSLPHRLVVDETCSVAVSKEEAESNVRWNHYQNTSIDNVAAQFNISIVAVERGSAADYQIINHDRKLRGLPLISKPVFRELSKDKPKNPGRQLNLFPVQAVFDRTTAWLV